MSGPDPLDPYPMQGFPRVGFLKPLVDVPNVEIGEFTYYDDPDGPEHFYRRCVRYHFPPVGDRLVIGRFCSIAHGALFIMNGANHTISSFANYPFNIFGKGWEVGFDQARWDREVRGDTVIGNDVWIGMDATIMPGVTVGDGAIIGTRAVVASDVPAYGVAVGNPARLAKYRFDESTIARLLAIAWWDWPIDKVTRHLDAIRGVDIERLETVAETDR